MRALLFSVVILGCAGGDEPGKAEPAYDAQSDVPLIEVSTEDTTGADTGASEDISADADAVVTDTAVADSTVADSTVADSTVVDTSVGDTAVPWTHTITIDGTNDFFAEHEKFTTTTTGYDAFLTWDATNVYFGMAGADVGTTTSPTKWVFLYIDVDPGTSLGALNSEKYNTQQAKLPTAYGAEYYLRWKTDDSYATIEKWNLPTSKWTTLTTTVERMRSGNFVEFKVPRATLGAATTFGLVSYMINERATVESTYGGLYSGNFTDGYAALKNLTKYLSADTLSPASPNAASRIKP